MENKLTDIDQKNIMNNFVKTDDILKNTCGIIESSQKAAYQAVNTTLVRRNWLLGYRIASEEMQGEERAEYGAEIIKESLKNCHRSMEKDLRNLIYIVFIHFIRIILRFSRHCLENLRGGCRGHIMQYYCR